jgi:putative membrane protein
MKMYRNYLARVPRVIKTGAMVGTTIFAVSTMQAQSTGQDQNPPPSASTQTSADITHKGKEFLKEAAKANQKEIAMANVGESKAQNPQVKELAHMMLTDHQQNYTLVQSLAQSHGVTIDTAPDFMNRREVDRLQKVNEGEFDKDFTKCMLKDHVKAIKRFDKAVTDVEDPDVKQYAQNTLPALRHHLQKSQEAARAAGLDESIITSILKDLPGEDRAVTSR